VRIEKAAAPDESQPQYAPLSEREPPREPLRYGAAFRGSGASCEALPKDSQESIAAGAAPTKAGTP
jgi:hypothetical protein